MRYKPWARPGARIDIPLRAINEDKCPGIKDGGWLLFMNYKVCQTHTYLFPHTASCSLRKRY